MRRRSVLNTPPCRPRATLPPLCVPCTMSSRNSICRRHSLSISFQDSIDGSVETVEFRTTTLVSLTKTLERRAGLYGLGLFCSTPTHCAKRANHSCALLVGASSFAGQSATTKPRGYSIGSANAPFLPPFSRQNAFPQKTLVVS